MKKKRKEGAVVTVGTFDGVHLGHQAILKRLCAIASEKKLERVAYAFTFPPRQGALRQTLKEQPKPCLLLPESAKLKLLKRYVDRVEQADFVEVRNLKAERFVREILLERLTARVIVVGDSFRFGRAREGDVSLLRRVGKEQGIFVVEVPSVVVDQAPVSSTWIRELVASGEVGEARALLGRPPLFVGEVVEGDGLGRRLGYPTANLAFDPVVLHPARGIYLVHAFWLRKRESGLLYFGVRPTLKGSAIRCEVHLLSSPDDDLYGKTMEVHLLQKLRGDRGFPSLEALREQMGLDAARARSLLPAMKVQAPFLLENS